MKKLGRRPAVFLLSILCILITGCSIYQKRIATTDEAVSSGEKVKVLTLNDETYVFQKIQREEDQLYGITKRGSATAKKLDGVQEGKKVKVPLREDTIEEIHLKDDTRSTLATIAIPVVILAAVITAAVISVNNLAIGFGDSN